MTMSYNLCLLYQTEVFDVHAWCGLDGCQLRDKQADSLLCEIRTGIYIKKKNFFEELTKSNDIPSIKKSVTYF